jgi:hypothetical protein
MQKFALTLIATAALLSVGALPSRRAEATISGLSAGSRAYENTMTKPVFFWWRPYYGYYRPYYYYYRPYYYRPYYRSYYYPYYYRPHYYYRHYRDSWFLNGRLELQ